MGVDTQSVGSKLTKENLARFVNEVGEEMVYDEYG